MSRFYIQHKETKLFLGSCHTTGDGIWVSNIKDAESWLTKEIALKDGLNYHPFFKLKENKIDIVEITDNMSLKRMAEISDEIVQLIQTAKEESCKEFPDNEIIKNCAIKCNTLAKELAKAYEEEKQS